MKKSQLPATPPKPILGSDAFPSIDHWRSVTSASWAALTEEQRGYRQTYVYALRRLIPNSHAGEWFNSPIDPGQRYLERGLVAIAEGMFRRRFEGRVGRQRSFEFAPLVAEPVASGPLADPVQAVLRDFGVTATETSDPCPA